MRELFCGVCVKFVEGIYVYTSWASPGELVENYECEHCGKGLQHYIPANRVLEMTKAARSEEDIE